MFDKFFSEHWLDAKSGAPQGGVSSGRGFTISWQNGPLGRGADRKAPNGAFVETVIAAVIDRINVYQTTRFKCEENEKALGHLHQAMIVLQERTTRREAQNVEGTLSGA